MAILFDPMRYTHRHGHCGGRAAGFTLIELMIAVLVVAVLMAIAYPSYQGHVIKTRRAAASACMLEAAQFMERFYTTNLRYNATPPPANVAVVLPALQCGQDLATHYTIGLAAGTTATTYSIQAVPRNQQLTKDTKCGTLTINQTGTKGEGGTATSANECF